MLTSVQFKKLLNLHLQNYYSNNRQASHSCWVSKTQLGKSHHFLCS